LGLEGRAGWVTYRGGPVRWWAWAAPFSSGQGLHRPVPRSQLEDAHRGAERPRLRAQQLPQAREGAWSSARTRLARPVLLVVVFRWLARSTALRATVRRGCHHRKDLVASGRMEASRASPHEPLPRQGLTGQAHSQPRRQKRGTPPPPRRPKTPDQFNRETHGAHP